MHHSLFQQYMWQPRVSHQNGGVWFKHHSDFEKYQMKETSYHLQWRQLHGWRAGWGWLTSKMVKSFLILRSMFWNLRLPLRELVPWSQRMVGLEALCKSPYNHCLSTEEVCANMSGDSSCLSQQQYICWYYWVVTTHLNLKFYQIDIYNSSDVSSAIEDILVLMVQARAIVP